MKKFNKRIFFFLVSMVAVVALLSSCDKGDELFFADGSQSDNLLSVNKNQAGLLAFPSFEFYMVKQNYLRYYTHYYEYQDVDPNDHLLKAPGINPTNSLCGAASLMVATGMVANGEKQQNDYYLVNKQGLVDIVKQLQKFGGYGHSQLFTCLRRFLGNLVGASESTTTDRTMFKDFIKKELKAGNPVVVPVVILSKAGVDHSRDIDHEDGSNDQIYYMQNHDIQESKRYFGHFVVLVSLQIERSGFGYVRYYDVLDRSKTIKTCSYKRLLDSNKMNSSNNAQYCAFSVKKK